MKNSENLSIRSIRKKILLMSKAIGAVLVISYILSSKLPFSASLSLCIWIVFVVLLIFYVLGCVIKWTLDYFELQNEEKQMEEGGDIEEEPEDPGDEEENPEDMPED